jgi:oligosaccharide repeat unit polymerase
LRNAAFLIAIVLLGFTILGSLRNVSSEYLVLALGYEDEFNLVFMWVYYYLTIGFTNLQSIIISSPPLSFGLQTFTPLLTLSGLKGFFLESTNPYFTGVGTFLETYYLDFGTLGTFFFPLILGIVSKLVYFKITRASIGIIIFTIYFTIINQLVFVFFTDYFSYTHIPLQVIVSLILYFLSKQNHFYSKKLKKVI